MPRRQILTYRDALRLLGAEDSRITAVVDGLGGFGAGAVYAATGGALDLFAVRDELVRWSRGRLNGIADRLAGLDRFDRTERIVAAHHVLVVTAFFDAVDAALRDAGLDPGVLELTAGERDALVAGEPIAEAHHELVTPFLLRRLPVPGPVRAPEAFREDLLDVYRELAERLGRFVSGLAVHDAVRARLDLDDPASRRDLAAAAVHRYEIAYRSLAAAVPEFGVWAATVEHAATRAAVLASRDEVLRRLDAATSAWRDRTDEFRDQLLGRYARVLAGPILEGEPPDGVELPTFERGCVVPRARVGDLLGGAEAPDAYAFAVAHLTGQDAVRAPLVVLGQPGSGKSTFTRLLAARLPAAGLFPVRVRLRDVPATSSVQEQVEQAVYDEIGRRLSWPDLAEHAGGLLPVLLLDGYDELLQAGGDDHADYLERVAAFQERELDLGRPVAAVVTSRSAVSFRMRYPAGTGIAHLSDFGRDEIERWLAAWNDANAAGLAGRGLRPLPLATVLAQGELAGQPLLLLLLAVYDAAANALQAADAPVSRADLYERLLQEFAAREVRKRHARLAPDAEAATIEGELRRLAATAVATFNRGGRPVTEAELDADLPALLGADAVPAREMAGRFFFVCESRAGTGSGPPRRVYEFVHRTFAEYLWARWVLDAVRDDDPAAAERLRAAISFAALSGSPATVGFVAERLSLDGRAALAGRLAGRLAASFDPVVDDYAPVAGTVVRRIAYRTLNLVILRVLAEDGPLPIRDVNFGTGQWDAWGSVARLWQSQLDATEWRGVLDTLRVANESVPVSWTAEPVRRTVVRREDTSAVTIHDSLPRFGSGYGYARTLDRPGVGELLDTAVEAPDRLGRALRQAALLQEDDTETWPLVALAPFWRAGGSYGGAPDPDTGVPRSRSLFEVLFTPPEDGGREERLDHYRLALTRAGAPYSRRDVASHWSRVVLERLAREVPALGAEAVGELLIRVEARDVDPVGWLAVATAVAADGAATPELRTRLADEARRTFDREFREDDDPYRGAARRLAALAAGDRDAPEA